MIKICAQCGLEFEATNGMQKYCNRKHYRKCAVCGQEFELTRYHLTARDAKTTCSKSCNAQLRKATNMSKYGGPAPASSAEVRHKMECTNMDRYGVKYAAQSQHFVDKAQKTSMIKYGQHHYSQTSEGRARLSQRWSDPEYKDKVRTATLSTNIEKYGVPNPMQSTFVKNRCSASKLADSTKSESFIKFKEDPRRFIEELHLGHKPTIQEICKYTGCNDSTVGVYINMHSCQDLIDYRVSTMEQEVIEFLRTVDPTIKISHRDRDMIAPYEIDVYLPDYKIGIECNPTATHNSDINVFEPAHSETKMKGVSASYHQMKTNICESKGIRLIHIFGYEWNNNKDCIKSILRNAIMKSSMRIYARCCEVRDISSSEANLFLDANHRQGRVNASIRFGLYQGGDLVAVMTFSKLRHTIGKSEKGYELLRFCSKLNTSVVGGASKLFNHFLNTIHPSFVRSFSDRAHTSGNLYRVLGFEETSRSSAGYCWVNLKSDVAYHRINAQKQNIQKFLKDPSIDLNRTEKEIMLDHGFVRVYDAGTITWEYRNMNDNQ